MEAWVLIYVVIVSQAPGLSLPAPHAVATATAEFSSDKKCLEALNALANLWGKDRVSGFCAQK